MHASNRPIITTLLQNSVKTNLNQALQLYTWPEIKIMQANVDDAKAYMDYVSWNLAQASTAEKQAMWTATLAYARASLTAAEAKLNAMIRSYDTDEVAIKTYLKMISTALSAKISTLLPL